MKARVLFLAVLLSAVTASLYAQVRLGGSVELLDASDDNTRVLFQVDGLSPKKGEVAQSARETLFSRLFHEGVEGINDDSPLVTKSKNYYVDNFFSKKNPAMNRFIVLEELTGAVNKNAEGLYVGTYELTINLKALVSALNKAGATDVPVVRAERPKDRSIGIGAGQKARPETAEAAPARLLITPEGVGPVRVGQNYTISEDVLNKCKLPASCATLYDQLSCDRNQFSGDFEIVGRLEGSISLLVYCDEEDQVSCFTVVTDQVKTKDELSTASMASEILAAGGKVQNLPLKENNRTVGYLYRIVKDGVYFLFGNSDVAGGKIKPDAKPYGISNTLFGGITEDELSFL